ncbi:MAG: hypothetical protein ACE5JX_22870, partial [Acidobacteriota bacterium]
MDSAEQGEAAGKLPVRDRTVDWSDVEDQATSVDFAYKFDQNGRVTQIKDNGGTTQVEYNYNGSRVAKRRYPTPDVDRDLSYDQVARLTKILQQKVTGPTDLASYAYWYDKASMPTKEQFLSRTNDPSSSFEYDTLNRLTYALYFDAVNNGTESFQYDDLGNRTYYVGRNGSSIAYLHNLVNEYTKIDATARGHDGAGSLIDDGTYTYD